MPNRFSRSELIFGKEALARLARARVAVFGIGGVGGHAAEALVRAGIGALDFIDSDVVSPSNLNRQIVALESTIGRYKADVMAERAADINPGCKISAHKVFYGPETASLFDFSRFDYIVDAVDTVSAKLCLIENAVAAGVPIISSMGAGNKLDPTALEVADIYETSVCPLARVMRYELKKRGIKRLKVVYSKEPPLKPDPALLAECLEDGAKKQPPGSCSFVPSAAGLIIAGEVVKDLIGLPRR